MIIKINNKPYYLAETEQHYTAWYPIDFDARALSADCLHKKIGSIDPQTIEILQNQYKELRNSDYNNEEDHFEHYNLRLDNTDYRFHTIDQINNAVCVYMEKGLFTLGEYRPEGYAWAHISADDDLETIQIKLYDHRKRFGEVMHKKLREICGW